MFVLKMLEKESLIAREIKGWFSCPYSHHDRGSALLRTFGFILLLLWLALQAIVVVLLCWHAASHSPSRKPHAVVEMVPSCPALQAVVSILLSWPTL